MVFNNSKLIAPIIPITSLPVPQCFQQGRPLATACARTTARAQIAFGQSNEIGLER